jgi:hypothetical protein
MGGSGERKRCGNSANAESSSGFRRWGGQFLKKFVHSDASPRSARAGPILHIAGRRQHAALWRTPQVRALPGDADDISKFLAEFPTRNADGDHKMPPFPDGS